MLKTDKNIRKSYKEYEGKVDIKTFITLCNNFNKFIFNKVLEGHEISLPYKLGTFQILGEKIKVSFNEENKPNLPPDWKKTKKLWERCAECKENKKIVYLTNSHTGGVRYKLFWSKRNVLVKNKTLYSFRLTRFNKRAIHKNIIEGKEYFIR